jgi:hypothetical protein
MTAKNPSPAPSVIKTKDEIADAELEGHRRHEGRFGKSNGS